MSKPLEGIRVLEFTHVIAGPFCGMLLGDLGADIVKIEKPGEGEYGRIAGPKMPNGTSLWFPNYNRNKKGITLNFKTPEAMEIVRRLVAQSDVLLENFRPGLLDEMGLGYEEIKKINPRIILVSLSGFGQEGPYARKTAFDMTVLALGGLMGLTGETEGIPMKMGTAVSDFVAGLYGVIGTLSALRHRDITGKGQFVDVAMLDAVLSMLETNIADYLLTGNEPGRPGNRRIYTAPSNVFPTSDGYIYVAGFFQSHWEKLCKLMQDDEMLNDPRLANGAGRKKNESEVERRISAWTKTKSVEELTQLMEEQGIPCAPINKMKDIVNDPHVKHRKSIVNFEYPGVGSFATAGFPVKFSDITTEVRLRPPVLGEHNKAVICEQLGFSEEEYERMILQDVF